jgi:hypothetical protein
MKEPDLFYLEKEEPVKGCLLFLRQHILSYDKNITEAWKYRMPFYCYNGKMFCYLGYIKRMVCLILDLWKEKGLITRH